MALAELLARLKDPSFHHPLRTNNSSATSPEVPKFIKKNRYKLECVH